MKDYTSSYINCESIRPVAGGTVDIIDPAHETVIGQVTAGTAFPRFSATSR